MCVCVCVWVGGCGRLWALVFECLWAIVCGRLCVCACVGRDFCGTEFDRRLKTEKMTSLRP